MRRLLPLTVLVVLALPACGSEDNTTDAQTTPAETTTEMETTTEEATTTEAESEGPQKIRITYRGGKLSGDTGTVRVRRGTEVELTVRADIEDEVHVHGYDLSAELAPGRPARITFEASERGTFITELEHLHLHIVKLRVGR